jgi:hypothetical protein
MTRQLTRGRALALASLLVPLAMLGEAGHLLLDQLNAVVAHHVFHLAFPLIAFGVFGGLVAHEVRAHGWPSFSWRLGTHEAPRSE